MANGNLYTLNNKAVWGEIEGNAKVEWTYDYLNKELLQHADPSNNFNAKYHVNINPIKQDLIPNSNEITIVDDFSNIRLDSSTLVVKANGKVLYIDYSYT